MNSQEQKEVAATILQQLGNNRFIAMTGAKNFVYSTTEQGDVRLSFKIGRNARRINHVRITLNSMDLYDTEYLWVTSKGISVKSQSSGIYNDMLRHDFESATGMYTSLGSMSA